MVTEYGTCEATGDGKIDKDELTKWYSFLDQHKISHCNWSLADKDESASALIPNASATGGWADNQITESGILVKREIASKK
jgi:endoglucanase